MKEKKKENQNPSKKKNKQARTCFNFDHNYYQRLCPVYQIVSALYQTCHPSHIKNYVNIGNIWRAIATGASQQSTSIVD